MTRHRMSAASRSPGPSAGVDGSHLRADTRDSRAERQGHRRAQVQSGAVDVATTVVPRQRHVDLNRKEAGQAVGDERCCPVQDGATAGLPRLPSTMGHVGRGHTQVNRVASAECPAARSHLTAHVGMGDTEARSVGGDAPTRPESRRVRRHVAGALRASTVGCGAEEPSVSCSAPPLFGFHLWTMFRGSAACGSLVRRCRKPMATSARNRSTEPSHLGDGVDVQRPVEVGELLAGHGVADPRTRGTSRRSGSTVRRTSSPSYAA